jgi:hypothetical protein
MHMLEDLKRKNRKLTFYLGDLVYKLYVSQSLRFFYTSDGLEQEKEVKRLLQLLDYLRERMEKSESAYPETKKVKQEAQIYAGAERIQS